LPGISGLQAIKLLKEPYPDLLLLVPTVFDDETRIFDALSCWSGRLSPKENAACEDHAKHSQKQRAEELLCREKG